MFTLEQIQESHSRIKNSKDFPAFVQSLIKLGVTGYDLYLSDRRAQYFGRRQFRVLEDAKFPEYNVALKWDKDRFQNILSNYGESRLNQVNFYEQLARVGVEKLALDTGKMTRTYYDIQGSVLHVEQLRRA